eukprot:scaffold90347_cov16-Prasinocladus_malaysianus.AAC.1
MTRQRIADPSLPTAPGTRYSYPVLRLRGVELLSRFHRTGTRTVQIKRDGQPTPYSYTMSGSGVRYEYAYEYKSGLFVERHSALPRIALVANGMQGIGVGLFHLAATSLAAGC